MARVDPFFGDGVAEGDDVVLKAHLRVRIRDSEDAASREAADALRALYDGAFADVEKAVAAASRFGFGAAPVYVTDGRRAGSAVLAKAQGVVSKKVVHSPGSRGGTWYRTKSGEIRYGKKPTDGGGGDAEDLSHDEIRQHLQHFRPTPFAADRDFVAHLIANAGYQIPVSGLFFLNWWFGEGIQKFCAAYGLTKDDLAGDMSRLRVQDDEAGDVSYEEAVYHFLRKQDWGSASESDVDKEMRALLERYHDIVSNPKVHDDWDNAGTKATAKLASWFADAHAREAEFQPLAEAVVGGADQPAAAARAIAAMSSLRLLIVPRGGKSSVGGMKGSIVPDSSFLAEHDRMGLLSQPDAESQLLSLSTGQLVAVYTAAALHATFDPDTTSYHAGAIPETGIGRAALHALRRKAGVDKGTMKAIGRNLDEVAALAGERLNAANAGTDFAGRALYDAGRSGKTSEEALAELQQTSAKIARERESILHAQEDDSFELPPTMKEGRWGAGGDAPFDFQRQAANWMMAAKRGVLSLDTTLGKTATVVSVVERLRQEGKIKDGEPAIIALPPSIMLQWPAAIAEYAPEIAGSIKSLHGMTRAEMSAVLQNGYANGASYLLVPSSVFAAPHHEEAADGGGDVLDILREMKGPLFVDEVHQQYRGTDSIHVRSLKHVVGDRQYAFGLTGTPSPNEPRDPHALASLFVPADKIGPRDLWDGRFGGQQWDDLDQQWEPTNREDLRAAGDLLKPHVFVRSALDKRVRAEVGARMKDPIVENNDLVVPPEMEPYFAPGGVADVMAEAKVVAIEEARKAKLPNRDMLRAGLALGFRRLAAFSPVLIDPAYKGKSPKLDRIVSDIVGHFTDGAGSAGAPAVVFSSFPGKVFPLLRKRLEDAGVHPSLIGVISGTTSAMDRRFFQQQVNAGRVKVLLVGVKAGGAGLELQHKANAAFMVDEPWDPGAKQQAIRRLVRLGQQDVVSIKNYRLASRDAPDWAVEDRIAGKQVKATWLLAGRRPEEAAKRAVDFVVGRQKSPLRAEDAARFVAEARNAALGPDTLGEEFGDVRDTDPASFDLEANFRDVVPDVLKVGQDVRDQRRTFVEKYRRDNATALREAAETVAAAYEKSGDAHKAAKYKARAAAAAILETEDEDAPKKKRKAKKK